MCTRLRCLIAIVQLAIMVRRSQIDHFLLPFLVWTCCMCSLAACQAGGHTQQVQGLVEWSRALQDLFALHSNDLKSYNDKDADKYVANGLRYLLFRHRQKYPLARSVLRMDLGWMYPTNYPEDIRSTLTEGIDDVFERQRERIRRWRLVPLVESFNPHGQPELAIISWDNDRVQDRSPDLLRLDYYGPRGGESFFLPTAIIRPVFSNPFRFKTVYTFPSAFINHVPEADQDGLDSYLNSKIVIWTAGLDPLHQFELRRKWSNIDATLLRTPRGSSQAVHEFVPKHAVNEAHDPPAIEETEFGEPLEVGWSSHSAITHPHHSFQQAAVQIRPLAHPAFSNPDPVGAATSGQRSDLPLEYQFQRMQHSADPYQPPMDPGYYWPQSGPSYLGHPYQSQVDPNYLHQYRSMASSSTPSYRPPEEHIFLPGASRTGDQAPVADYDRIETQSTSRARPRGRRYPPSHTFNDS